MAIDSITGTEGYWIERPMGRGPTFVPKNVSSMGDANWPYYVGDPPGWMENMPGDRLWPKPAPYIYPDSPWTPYSPPYPSPESIQETVKRITDRAAELMREQEMKHKTDIEKAVEAVKFNHRPYTAECPDKTEFQRAIDINIAGYDKKDIRIKVKKNVLSVTTVEGVTKTWPPLPDYQFDIDEVNEEVMSAKADNGILTIIIKSIKVAPKETVIEIL